MGATPHVVRCFRHQLLRPHPYLVLTKPLRLDIQCQRAASVLVPGVEQFLLVDDVIAVEDGAALVPGQEHGDALGDAGADLPWGTTRDLGQ